MKRARLTLPDGPAALFFVAVLDILVVILVFFVLVTSVAQEAGFAVELPESGLRLSRLSDSVVVTAKGGSEPVVFVGRRRVGLDQLGEHLQNAPSNTVLLKADKQLPLETWMRIVDACQQQELRVIVLGEAPGGDTETPAPPSGNPDPDEKAEP